MDGAGVPGVGLTRGMRGPLVEVRHLVQASMDALYQGEEKKIYPEEFWWLSRSHLSQHTMECRLLEFRSRVVSSRI